MEECCLLSCSWLALPAFLESPGPSPQGWLRPWWAGPSHMHHQPRKSLSGLPRSLSDQSCSSAEASSSWICLVWTKKRIRTLCVHLLWLLHHERLCPQTINKLPPPRVACANVFCGSNKVTGIISGHVGFWWTSFLPWWTSLETLCRLWQLSV